MFIPGIVLPGPGAGLGSGPLSPACSRCRAVDDFEVLVDGSGAGTKDAGHLPVKEAPHHVLDDLAFALL
jgi:hypothetical protein